MMVVVVVVAGVAGVVVAVAVGLYYYATASVAGDVDNNGGRRAWRLGVARRQTMMDDWSLA